MSLLKNSMKCVRCEAKFQGHHNAKFCSVECTKAFKEEQLVRDSHLKFTAANQDTWVECPICKLRARQMASNHFTHKHGMSYDEVKAQYPDVRMLSDELTQKNSERVSGENNPGFNHGGKLSPFSKKSVKYEGLTEEEKQAKVDEMQQKRADTSDENDSYQTRIGYWLKQGMTEDEAREALYERQNTFTLEKCIAKHGEIEGPKVYEERQRKWQETLNSKPQEEINAINAKKSTKINYRTLWSLSLDSPGKLYLIEFDSGRHKIGVTTKETILERYDRATMKEVNLVRFLSGEDINHCFMIEQLVKRKFAHQIRLADYGPFGWTEVINDTNQADLLEMIDKYINDRGLTEVDFNTTIKCKQNTSPSLTP